MTSSGLNRTRCASANPPIAEAANSIAHPAKAPVKRGVSISRAKARKVPLVLIPSSATLMII